MYLTKQQIEEIQNRINYQFKNTKLLEQAFRHRSLLGGTENNERLEFLGDAVLDLVISSHLFQLYPNATEKDLTTLRSKLVDGRACLGYTLSKSLDEFLLLGKGEEPKNSILADLFESIVGAVYVDGGLEVTTKFILENFWEQMVLVMKNREEDWKSTLQFWVQKKFKSLPVYTLVNKSGPDHKQIFVVDVVVVESQLPRGTGSGTSKKMAEQMAAKEFMSRVIESGQ
jgi:ribonuclease-3